MQNILGERRTFVYHNPDPCEIVYYQGQRITRIRDEPLREFVQDVTFVCFDDTESGVQVVLRSINCGVNHDRVLPARGDAYDAGIDKYLVCFDRFDGFLTQADLTFLASLEDPNSSHKVPGNPNDVVQSEIRELSAALNHMNVKGVSSSLLHLPIGYAWCPPEDSRSRGKLKIIMLDVDVRKDHTSMQWKNIIARDLQRFGTGLDKYFLNTTVDWPQKDSFMRCFSIRLQDENMRLLMIHDHPFLKDELFEILQIFSRVYQYIGLSYHESPLELTKLMVALNNRQFKSEFMPNGEWTRQEMSPEFEEFLRGEPRGNSYKYNTNDMGDLVRFLRNLFENGPKNGMRLRFIFNEVGRYWPHVIDRIHEKITRTQEDVRNLY